MKHEGRRHNLLATTSLCHANDQKRNKKQNNALKSQEESEQTIERMRHQFYGTVRNGVDSVGRNGGSPVGHGARHTAVRERRAAVPQESHRRQEIRDLRTTNPLHGGGVGGGRGKGGQKESRLGLRRCCVKYTKKTSLVGIEKITVHKRGMEVIE